MLAVTPLMGATSLYRAGVGYANAWYQQAPGLVGLWFDAVEPGGDQVKSATDLRTKLLQTSKDSIKSATNELTRRHRGPRALRRGARDQGQVRRGPLSAQGSGRAGRQARRQQVTKRRAFRELLEGVGALCRFPLASTFRDFGGRGQPRPSHRREGAREPGVAHSHKDLGWQQLDRRRARSPCRVPSPVCARPLRLSHPWPRRPRSS